jgi:hypothetical protein
MTPAFTLCCGVPARAAERGVAVFKFGLGDTSPHGAIYGLAGDAGERLAWGRRKTTPAPGANRAVRGRRWGAACRQGPSADLRSRGCDAQLAGATLAIAGWVQKVSNVIRNINARDTGKVLADASAHARRNTQESRSRALADAVANRLLGPGAS